MAARLLKQPEKCLVPNYIDDLESFWHTLLYTTLRRCEHAYDPEKIVLVLNQLFDYKYKWRGSTVGGGNKRTELKKRMTLQEMGICSPPLFHVLRQSAKILAARYPENEYKVEEITRLKREYEGDDFRRYLRKDHERLYVSHYKGWANLQILETSGWMEKVFDAVLENDDYDWDWGGRNVERWLPTLDASSWNDRRRLDPRYVVW